MQNEPTMTHHAEHHRTQQNNFYNKEVMDLTKAMNHGQGSISGRNPGVEQQIPLSPQELILIHAVSLAANDYKQSESILVLRFCKLAETQAFKKCGYPNLFTFAVKHLGLTEGTAYLLVKVAKKAQEIPLVIHEITSNELSLRTVGRLAPVLTSENAATLFARAKTMTSRELEHLVATLNPRSVRRDHCTALNSEDTRVSVTLNQAELATLTRCQELLMQKRQGAVSLAQTVAGLAADYLKRHSPEQKAARAEARRKKNSSQQTMTEICTEDRRRLKDYSEKVSSVETELSEKASSEKIDADCSQAARIAEFEATALDSETKTKESKPLATDPESGVPVRDLMVKRPKTRLVASHKAVTAIANVQDEISTQAPHFTIQEITPSPKYPRVVPAKIVHFVGHRDQHRCTHVNPSGERCGEKKFLHLHHIKPLSEGGNHHPDNLTQLCAYHHDLAHQLTFADWVER